MRELLKEFYERRALDYSDRDLAARIRYQKALAQAELRPEHQILDIACRDAVMLGLLPEHRVPATSYTGVDLSETVLRANRARNPGVRFLNADASVELPVEPGTFDRVFALEILEHVPQPLAMLQQIRRVLKPSGRLILSVPNPYYYMEVINEIRDFPDTEGHIFSYGQANIRLLFQLSGFAIQSVSGTYLEIPKKVRGAFRDQATWFLTRVPPLLARSRIYDCALA